MIFPLRTASSPGGIIKVSRLVVYGPEDCTKQKDLGFQLIRGKGL